MRLTTSNALAAHLTLGVLVCGALGLSASAAPPRHAASSTPAPPRIARLANGHPDLNGVWEVLNDAGWNVEPHGASAALQTQPGPAGPVPDHRIFALGAVASVPPGDGVIVGGGTIPYKPEKLKERDENRAHYLERDPEVKCDLPGVPRATYMGQPFQILQSDRQLLFTYQYASAVRNILMKDPGEAPVDSWMGQSWARWEGDTLVVTVSGFNDSTWLDRAGNFHSDQLKVTERYTPIDATHLRYQAHVEDPETYTRPWDMEMTLYKRVGADARLGQFKCVEFVEELMYGNLRKHPVK